MYGVDMHEDGIHSPETITPIPSPATSPGPRVQQQLQQRSKHHPISSTEFLQNAHEARSRSRLQPLNRSRMNHLSSGLERSLSNIELSTEEWSLEYGPKSPLSPQRIVINSTALVHFIREAVPSVRDKGVQ